jgi:hypothetical protein
MGPDLLKRLLQIEEQIESDPKNLELRKEKRCLTKSLACSSKMQGDAPRETH